MVLVRISAVNGTVWDIEINTMPRGERYDSLSIPRGEESLSQKWIHYLDGADDAVRHRSIRYRPMDQVRNNPADPVVVITFCQRTGFLLGIRFCLCEGRLGFVGDGVGHHYGFAYVVTDAVVGNQAVDAGLVETFPH